MLCKLTYPSGNYVYLELDNGLIFRHPIPPSSVSSIIDERTAASVTCTNYGTVYCDLHPTGVPCPHGYCLKRVE